MGLKKLNRPKIDPNDPLLAKIKKSGAGGFDGHGNPPKKKTRKDIWDFIRRD